MKLQKSTKKKIAQAKEKKAEIMAYRKKHAGVFDKLKELEAEFAELEGQVKDDLRSLAPGGSETATAYKDDNLIITIQSKQRAPTYDATKAKAFWPAAVYKRCVERTINAAALAEVIEEGGLEDELLAKAENPREAITAAVSFKFKQ